MGQSKDCPFFNFKIMNRTEYIAAVAKDVDDLYYTGFPTDQIDQEEMIDDVNDALKEIGENLSYSQVSIVVSNYLRGRVEEEDYLENNLR